MKIDNVFIRSINGVKEPNRLKQKEDFKLAGGKDGLLVSNQANDFKVLLKKAQEVPAVREERVQELSNKIANNDFKIDVKMIAQRILSIEE